MEPAGQAAGEGSTQASHIAAASRANPQEAATGATQRATRRETEVATVPNLDWEEEQMFA
jgi:hypothetical protein